MHKIGYEQILKTAKDKFGINNIFPYQLLVISNILDACSKNENDENLEAANNRQIVLFPTGAGKSLCFQLPSLFLEKPTLVIYPLLSLMRDQYNKLKNILNTVILIGGQTREERLEQYRRIKDAHIIIANPEILANKEVLKHIKERGIAHLAIDEAHCVSEWGQSFRPSYLNLSSIIQELNPIMVSAFTATASEVVLQKMKQLIFNKDVNIIQSSLDRPNISFASKHCVVKEPLLLQEIEKREKPIVVFCSSRKRCEQLSRLMSIEMPTIQTEFYHAGLEKSEKEKIEQWFYKAKNACLVATCAYGMGVDKKDIRTVIHFEMPSTIEAYIQEAGRGGRDRERCSAILLWNEEDEKRMLKLKNEEIKRAELMISFAKTPVCKRHFLLRAMSLGKEREEEMPICGNCDVCTGEAEEMDKKIKNVCNYIKRRKIKREDLIGEVSINGKYWNMQYATKLISYMEKEHILIEDKLFWRGKLKVRKNTFSKS